MDAVAYQVSRNGPLTPEAIAFLKDYRLKNALSYAALGAKLGISQAFTHNILNKNMNLSTDTYMAKVSVGIEALKGNGIAPVNHAEIKPRLLDHTYHLRDDLQVTLKLPVNLTNREAERLAQFINSLAH